MPGLQRCAVRKAPDVSKQHIASIFIFACYWFLPVYRLAYSQTLKMEVICFSEMSGSVRYNPEHIFLSDFRPQIAHQRDWFVRSGIKSYPCNRPWRPIELWDVEVFTFSRQSAHKWRWGCQHYASSALYPQEDSWYSFLSDSESNPGP
jgi:hypothetical protein